MVRDNEVEFQSWMARSRTGRGRRGRAPIVYGKVELRPGTSASRRGGLIRPKCITILYCNSPLFIDIFHFIVLFLCCFGLFYTVCNFPVPKQQKQDSTVKSGHQVAESDHSKFDEILHA